MVKHNHVFHVPQRFFLKQMKVSDYLKYGTYMQSDKNATNTCGSINF